MNKIIKRAALVLAAGASTVGLLAAVAPAEASAASRGTVTKTEARKVVKQGTNQNCLTLRETRKIIHGTGKQTYSDGTYREYMWKGGKGVTNLYVGFDGKCAVYGEAALRNGKYLSFFSPHA